MKTAYQPVVIGIDVAKKTLATAVVCAESGRLLDRRGFDNTPPGHRALIAMVQRYGDAHLVMEATGNYHRKLSRALFEAGLPQSVINPLQLKRFGQMRLSRVKTDRCDAVLIAHYGQNQRPEAHQPDSAAQQQLKQINTLIDQLVKQRTALKNLQHAQSLLPESAPLCEAVVKEQIEAIDHNLERLEEQQKALADELYRRERALIESIKGIGPKTALVLLAYVGSLESFRRYKELIAFTGLNPVPMQSGEKEVQMHISKQGHARIRTLLYRCAHSARKYNPACRALYERLIAQGKKKKVALIAVANKLIKQVFAVIKSGVPYDKNYANKLAPIT